MFNAVFEIISNWSIVHLKVKKWRDKKEPTVSQ